MIDTYNLSEFRSFRRALPIVGAFTLFLAITLAAPPRLWGQCSNQNPSYTGAGLSGVNPASVIGGSGTVLSVTITLDGVAGPYPFMAAAVVGISGVQAYITSPLYYGYVPIWTCTSSTTVTFTVGSVNQTTTGVFHAGGLYGAGDMTAPFEVVPSGPAENPANLGQCKQCQQQAGRPVNLTDGNVWIPQRDYSVPGLGGGLELSRVWNSRWVYSNPPAIAGMLGFGWRSTYEEQLALSGQTLQG